MWAAPWLPTSSWLALHAASDIVAGRSTRSLDCMAKWHLNELREALERKGWRFVSELPGDGRAISGRWKFERSGQPSQMVIDFHGLDDLAVLSMSESYACYVQGSSHSLYFRRRGEKGTAARDRWKGELLAFVAGVEAHAI